MFHQQRIRLVLWCILVLAARLNAGPKSYDFQRKVLDNGLTVVSLEDHSCPIVAVQVWYQVGSKDEDPKRQGFAHMFEHMMFRGTDVLTPEKHFEYVRQSGGDCNAYTSFDNTTYVNDLPSNQLELALWLEAERMAFLKIDDESFYKERAVVEEERRLRSMNTPYGMVPERLLPAIFTQHPYQWTPIGQIPHLRAATIDELQGFWDKYYVPANATLVVVGDVTHSQVQSMAEKYFGWIPKMPVPPRVTTKEPPQKEARTITIPEKKGPVPIVGLVYRGVSQDHPDALPLEMLMTIVGGGESSRLYRDLVKERQIAQMAVGGAFSLQDDGLLGAGAVLMPWGNKEKAIAGIREHLQKVRDEPVTPRELDKAKNQFLSRAVTESLTVASKAQVLGGYQVLEGDAERANKHLERIRAVTIADLQRVSQTYLTEQRETMATVQPEVGGMLKSLFGGKEEDVNEGAAPAEKPTENRVAKRGGLRGDLKRPPSQPTTPPISKLLDRVPTVSFEEKTLPTGLKIVVIPNHEVPYVTISLGILNGAWTETKPGTASLAANMITKGTAKHSAAELAEELEFNAISLSGDATMDVAQVEASGVSDKFDLAMTLLAEVVRTPTFPKNELEILRQQVALGLMIRDKTPEYIVDREFRRKIYGSHPYSRTPTGEGKDVQALALEDIKGWWSTFVRPDSCVLYIAGDVELKAALAKAEAVFGDWKMDAPKPTSKLADIPSPSGTHIYLVDRPGSVQSQIRVGHLGYTRRHEEYFNGVVLSQVFGGAFNSRLNKAIRIEKGLTYGARGGFQPQRFAGSLQISTFTKTPSTGETLGVILDEIKKIKAAAPTVDEVEQSQSYLIGSFAGDRETPSATVRDLWLIDYADLPRDYLPRWLNGIRDCTSDKVLYAARKLIQEDKLTIVVVGEAKAIQSDLEKFGPVTVVKSDAEEAPQAPTIAP
ncbi:MAG: pitrilysin family protein [Planctomycetota bacterium]